MFKGHTGRCFDVMAAMGNNRGIGYMGKLPWPSLRKEYAYFNGMTSTPLVKGKKCVRIRGRMTWYCADPYQHSRDDVVNVVITRDPSNVQRESNIHHIASSFDDALDFCFTSSMTPNIDRVWVLGGQDIYQLAVRHPLCRRIYLTHVEKEFPADRFFPPFEEDFQEIQTDEVDHSGKEENGITYRVRVYERRHIARRETCGV